MGAWQSGEPAKLANCGVSDRNACVQDSAPVQVTGDLTLPSIKRVTEVTAKIKSVDSRPPARPGLRGTCPPVRTGPRASSCRNGGRRGRRTCTTLSGKRPVRPQARAWPAPESRLFSREVLHTDTRHGPRATGHGHLKAPTQRLRGRGLRRSPARGRAPCVGRTHLARGSQVWAPAQPSSPTTCATV